jgi:molecular chaperone GrpE
VFDLQEAERGIQDKSERPQLLEGGKKVELPKSTEALEEALRKEHERAEEYLLKLKYLQAEFENYRKRVDREKTEASSTIADKMVIQLLNVLDEMELALIVAKKTDDRQALISGIEMMKKKLSALLEEYGVRPIEALGKVFDPSLHEAVQQVESSEDEEGKVVEEVRRGYTLRGKVIRASMVKVGALTKKDEKQNHNSGVNM